MNKIPEVQTILKLVKLDSEDFNRKEVVKRIGITPAESKEPMLAQGKIRYNNIMDVKKTWGNTITVLDEGDMPYPMLFHAYLLFELKREKHWYINDALDKLREKYRTKEKVLCEVCKQYNLQIDISVKIYTDREHMAITEIQKENLCFLSNIGANIDIVFWWDD